MISRRRILSHSRDELNFAHQFNDYYEEEDVWYTKDKLFKDHIQEILIKWDQIDDEIWAKIICLERNRRVAKAYARAPILTINGCDNGFDGYRIGLNGFDNPMRDVKTEDVKRNIGNGVKVKMDQDGNIIIKRISKSNVYVKGWQSERADSSNNSNDNNTSVGNEIIKSNGLLELQKSVKLFDIKKFQSNIHRELKCAYPDRRKLETQCISCIAFVRDASDILDLSSWVMIINIVALDMLKTKLPPIDNRRLNSNLVQIIDRTKNQMEEDPYSMPGNSSSSSGGSGSANAHYGRKQGYEKGSARPPKLPPRDLFSKKAPLSLPKPDYDYDLENMTAVAVAAAAKSKNDNHKLEDPYYCGFKARVPNFAKRSSQHQQQPQQPLQKTQSNPIASKQDPPILKKASNRGLIKSLPNSNNNNNNNNNSNSNSSSSGSSSNSANNRTAIVEQVYNDNSGKKLSSNGTQFDSSGSSSNTLSDSSAEAFTQNNSVSSNSSSISSIANNHNHNNNDIYGVNRKSMANHRKYAINNYIRSSTSAPMHQMFFRNNHRLLALNGYVGEWE